MKSEILEQSSQEKSEASQKSPAPEKSEKSKKSPVPEKSPVLEKSEKSPAPQKSEKSEKSPVPEKSPAPQKSQKSSSLSLTFNSAAIIADKEDYETIRFENERLKKENEAKRLEIQKLLSQIDKKDELISHTQSQLLEKDHYLSKLIDEDIAILKAENEQLRKENANLRERVSLLEEVVAKQGLDFRKIVDEQAQIINELRKTMDKQSKEKIQQQKANQMLSDRSLISDAIHNLYELFIVRNIDVIEEFQVMVTKKEIRGGCTNYIVDLKTFFFAMNSDEFLDERKTFIKDQFNLFTNKTLSYDQINLIYHRVVNDRNSNEQVHPLSKKRACTDLNGFLKGFNELMANLENFSTDAARV